MNEQPHLQAPDLKTATTAEDNRRRLKNFPWWLIGIFLIAIFSVYIIYSNEEFGEAFNFIKAGLQLTITTSLFAYLIAMVIGLIVGLGRISKNVVLNNLARLYIEFIRGIPMLVLIFTIALVGVPMVLDALTFIGEWLISIKLGFIGTLLTEIDIQDISMHGRAIIALSVTYGAFLAEIFRAGIQSIGHGQMEAARSLGMSYAQAMRYIILPQAIRNVLPALGNDFVAMVKDSSLISLLGVRDITQMAKVYSGSSFRYREAYLTLSVLYLTLTVTLSIVVQFIERRLRKND